MARMSRARFSIRQVFFAVAAVIIFLLLADFNDRWNEKQRLTLQYEQALEELARHLRRNSHRRYNHRAQDEPLHVNALEGG